MFPESRERRKGVLTFRRGRSTARRGVRRLLRAHRERAPQGKNDDDPAATGDDEADSVLALLGEEETREPARDERRCRRRSLAESVGSRVGRDGRRRRQRHEVSQECDVEVERVDDRKASCRVM